MFYCTGVLPWTPLDNVRVQDREKVATYKELQRDYVRLGSKVKAGVTEEMRTHVTEAYEQQEASALADPSSTIHELARRKDQQHSLGLGEAASAGDLARTRGYPASLLSDGFGKLVSSLVESHCF